MIDPVLEYRLSQIQSRINEDRFLKNNGSGNEIGFWIFDYPAQCELQVREHLKYLLRHLEKDHKFACLNVFQIIIDMLNERGLFERVCQQEVKVGTETLKKQLAGPLNQKKIADFIAKKSIWLPRILSSLPAWATPGH
ncbi:Domain of uncharacterised function (DUF1788) [Escherichia coli]|uniref:Domain of uncharacterized function (DUF1788) n=1 Tax=Escherichia coli TaxID=562 RepID=A0A376RRM7_ECOLX|nr:Domain of uncharacterised function (DUF1788) [Escherichia coli]